ncbi:hypothetical protein ACF07S_10395 [Streptomyces sp. NPDC016640]|uniref:hypothetical protein n=1 Tax=Streptomyces sp. NPDC016640 TaxID=3364969 RepID=UPI0036F5CC30
MARLQILELPEGTGDDRPPFILVIDQMPNDEPGFEALRRDLSDGNLAERIGSRAVLVFEDTIDIPANDTSAYLNAPAAAQKVVVELAGQDPQGAIDAAIRKAKDGLRLAEERTDIARDMDRLAKWRHELTDALGINQIRDWDEIRNAAAALRRERDAQTEAIERVRNLPEQPEIMNAQHPDPSGYLHGYGVAIREVKRATYPPERAEPVTDA